MTLTDNILTRRDALRGIGATALVSVAGRRAYAAEYHRADAKLAGQLPLRCFHSLDCPVSAGWQGRLGSFRGGRVQF